MKFKSKYRIEPARLRSWNYASPGLYFVTICTSQVEPYLGKIDKGVPILNGLGQIAYKY